MISTLKNKLHFFMVLTTLILLITGNILGSWIIIGIATGTFVATMLWLYLNFYIIDKDVCGIMWSSKEDVVND